MRGSGRAAIKLGNNGTGDLWQADASPRNRDRRLLSKGEGSNDPEDSTILAMANRSDNSQMLDDPDIIEGPNDAQYWKDMSGSKRRRQMRGSGLAAIKLENGAGGDPLSDAENSRRSRKKNSRQKSL